MSTRIFDPRLLDSRYSAIGYRPEWRQRYIIGEQGRTILGVDLKAGEAFATSAVFDTAPLAACVAPLIPGAKAINPVRKTEPGYVEFHVYVLTADGTLWRLDRDTLVVLKSWPVGGSYDHRWLIPSANGILFPGRARGEIALWSQVSEDVEDRRVVSLTDSVVAQWIPGGEADRFYVFDDRGKGQVIDWDPITHRFIGRAQFRADGAVDILDTFVDTGEAYLYYQAPRTLTVLALGPRGDGVRASYDITDPLHPVESVSSFDGSEYVIRSATGAAPARFGSRRDAGQFPALPWWPGPAMALAPADPGADRRPGAVVVASEQGQAWVIPDDPPAPAYGEEVLPLVEEISAAFVTDGVSTTYLTSIPYSPRFVPTSGGSAPTLALLQVKTPPTPATIVQPTSITNVGGFVQLGFSAPPAANAVNYACSALGTNGSEVNNDMAFFDASLHPVHVFVSDGVTAAYTTDIPWADNYALPATQSNADYASFSLTGYLPGSSGRSVYTQANTNPAKVASISNDGGFVRVTLSTVPLAGGVLCAAPVIKQSTVRTPAGGPWLVRVRIRAQVEGLILGAAGELVPSILGNPAQACQKNPTYSPSSALTIDRFQVQAGSDFWAFNVGPVNVYQLYDYVVELDSVPGDTDMVFSYNVRCRGNVQPQTVLVFRDFSEYLPPDDDGGAPFALYDTRNGRIGVAVQADILAFIPVE